METDIRETGPVGLKYNSNRGLRQDTDSNPLMQFLHQSGKNVDATVNQYAGPSREYVGEELANLGVGSSQYDDELSNMSQANNLNEFRAQEQPWYDQIANGALKMVTTAATTFVDGTVGALYGLGTGIANLLDDDPDTGFWRGMWDNAISNAMADVNDRMEEVAHNYRSEWEQNASVFERMFSSEGAANFWGDDILKNAGFTIGAAASILATGAVGNALKGVSGLSKLGRGIGLLTRASNGAVESTKAGKAASWLAKTFVSTQGEASIEALNAIRESTKAADAEVLAMKQQGEEDAAFELQYNIANGMSLEEANTVYRERLAQLDTDLKAYQNHMQQELSDAGNMIYAANIAALSLSNNFTLGSMIRGGYGNSKSLLKQALKTSGGKPIETAKEAGEALLKGDLRLVAPNVQNRVAKTLGHWALESSQEGLEEGVQNLASNVGQIVASARTHQWAKDNTMLSSMINTDAEEGLISYSKALGKAYEEQFGHLNSPGWTEVMAGFITGALGVAGVHRNEQGNIRPTWQGGLKESWETVNGNQKAVQAQADMLNKALTDNKFNDRVRHAVQQTAIREGQEEALQRGDTQAFKNFEVQQLLGDAVFFRDMGMLDDYLAMYEAMADGITDQDVAELKAMAKPQTGEASALEQMSDDEIKRLYQDKAKSALEKIQESLNDYKAIEDQYGDKFSDETRREATMEMAFLNTLYWDTQRRRDEIESQIETLEQNENRTPLEDEDLKQKQTALDQLKNQAFELRDTLNEYKKSPKLLQEKVENRQAERQKVNLYKKAEAAIAKYREAETLQDIVDIYAHSPEEDREQVLTQAIEQAEGDTKDKLQQFKKYIGDVSTLEHLIDDRFPVSNQATAANNIRMRAAFRGILNEAVNTMLTDEAATLTRATLKERFSERLQQFQNELQKQQDIAGGVTADDEGNVNVQEALNAGLITEDDFEEVLDNEETGESHWQIKEGSEADRLATAASRARDLQKLVNDMSYFTDSLDQLDELREAGKKKAEKKKEIKKGKHVTVEEEVIEGESDNDAGDDSGSFDFNDEDEGSEGGQESSDNGEPKGKSSILDDSESSTYAVKPKKGASGITYNTIQKKGPDNKKAKESVSKKLTNTANRLQVKMEAFRVAGDKHRKQLMDDILGIVKDNPISNKTMKEVEEFFKINSKFLKPKSGEDDNLPPYMGGELPGTDISMNGNQHAAYVTSELKKGKMVPVTYQKSGAEPLQVWMANEGYNPQEIIDNYLGKVINRDKDRAVKDRTPVYYLHNNAHPEAIFLAVEYSQVENVIPKTVARKLVKGQDGKDYLIVGTFGWEASREGTKGMYQGILDSMVDGEHTEEGWHVNADHTNRVKDFQAGYTVRQTEKDNSPQVRDLRELLSDPERNPSGLTIDNLSWTVIEGTEEKPTRKIINGEASKTYAVKGGKPGQVYLNIPASNGNSIPIYMETMFLNELEEDTPLGEEIKRHISILADPESTIQDKKSAIAQLKDLLIFSPTNQIHLNDEDNKIDPNTIYVTKDGQPIKVLDFDEMNSDDPVLTLTEAIKSINPRINLLTTLLDRNPSIYLNSGVLKTDIALLGTVNSSFFLFPIDSNGEYVENKPFKGTGRTYEASTRNRIYVAGKYVYYDGNKFTDAKGSRIEDEDGTLTAALKIKQGKIKPTKVGKTDYYVVDGSVYVDNGHGGINEVGSSLRDKVLSVAENKSKQDKRKESSRREAERTRKRKENAPIEEDSRLKGGQMEDIKEGEEDDWDDEETVNAHFLSVPTTEGGMREVQAEKVDYLSIKKGDRIWYSGPETSTPIAVMEIQGVFEGGSVYGDNGLLPKGRTYYREVGSSPGTPSKKSNFSNSTDIEGVKTQAELEAEAASSSFTAVLNKRENRAKTKELLNLIENIFGKKVTNAQDAVKELLNGHNLDLSSNDLDTIIEQVKNCR